MLWNLGTFRESGFFSHVIIIHGNIQVLHGQITYFGTKFDASQYEARVLDEGVC